MFSNVTIAQNEYDPRISTLVEKCDTDWGDPIKNRERLISYGLRPIDMALYGIDPEGELVVIQGEEKNRKSTFAANIVVNIMTTAKQPPTINIDTLESGMRPEKYRDMLISIVATHYLFEHGHVARRACPACNTDKCMYLGISPKFLKYNSRKPEQMRAVEFAKNTIKGWPLLLHGASVKQGNTRNLKEAVIRWRKLIDLYELRILTVDHIQQYAYSDEPTDYEKQIRGISTLR